MEAPKGDGARLRALESLTPRPGDRIAHRIRALAAWAKNAGATTEVAGLRVDAEILHTIADKQSTAEDELIARYEALRTLYPEHVELTRKHESLMRSAIEGFERARGDEATRRALRLCKLRRPPLAKIRAMTEAAYAPATTRTGTSNE